LLLAASGCGGSKDDDGDDPAGGGTIVGGGEACQAWRTSFCDLVERCGVDATVCRQQVPAIACADESEADRCSAALDVAACDGVFPAGCDVPDIADRSAASQKCETFIDTLCGRSEECEAGSGAECSTAAATSLDCSTALGVMPSYDQCLDELAVLACTAAELPTPCQSLVLTDG